ncbi:MAG: gamma-glutamyltransferase family protein [Chloroflexi bacterium]|nr:gamma-glutamyltransferase family protein [Chloroflexota bacterium]
MKIPEPIFSSRRSPVYGRRGIVAASQPLAVAAGLKILEQGGNAADAAVATAAGLNVTEPSSTGLGGDCFALFYDARTRQVSALNGSGRAPRALTLERVRQAGFIDELPPYHAYNVTVPGACAGWCDLVERFGHLPLTKTLAPAIQLAEEGFPVSPLTAHNWQESAQTQLRQSLNGIEMTIDGRGPHAGEIFRNPGLARAMRAIAEGGKKAYYEGSIAEGVVAILNEAGGCMDLQDLADHHSTWEQPISVTYRGLRIWECPPNGQGIATLLALNLLEGFDLAALTPLSAARLHLEIEAMRLAFADTRYYVADPACVPVPVEALLDKNYASQRRGLIDPLLANPQVTYGVPHASSDTIYLSVVDGEGNACSFINSNYMGFGSGIVPRGWGFSLQNRGNNFSLDPKAPNVLAPGKRPYHTIIPAMATYAENDSLYASFGVMGGFMQPQGHLQVVIALLEDGFDPQTALDLPRFCIAAEHMLGPVALEEGISIQTMAALADMGHTVRPVSGWGRGVFGRGQIIRRDPATGVLCAGSDPRADGCAMSLV